MIYYVQVLRHARLRTTALDLTYTRHRSIEAFSTCIGNEDHEDHSPLATDVMKQVQYAIPSSHDFSTGGLTFAFSFSSH
jgi:hypothetical protein